MSAEAAGIARRAAAEIRRRGLNKGAYSGPGAYKTCTFCIVGALSYAHNGIPDDEDWLFWDFGRRLTDAINNRTGHDEMAMWNDRPETTAADVIALLNAVADDLDAQ